MSQLTITQDGKVLTETQDGVTMPADYSFATVNDYVNSPGREYEELECLALGMACHVDKIEKQRDDLLAELSIPHAVHIRSGQGLAVSCAILNHDDAQKFKNAIEAAIARTKGAKQ